MPATPKPVVFVGPTASGLRPSVRLRMEAECECRAPVRRGDLPHLVRERGPGVIVIVDGAFHQCLAVAHAELRDALREGWQVWGLSSMGAVRAYEMRGHGLRGFGRVFRLFCEGDDFQDDEVALLHEPDPPYRAFSEPLVHLRAVLTYLRSRVLTPADHERLLDTLKGLWYGDRSIERFESVVIPCVGELLYRQLVPGYDPFRLKTKDLAIFIRARIWTKPAGAGRPFR